MVNEAISEFKSIPRDLKKKLFLIVISLFILTPLLYLGAKRIKMLEPLMKGI